MKDFEKDSDRAVDVLQKTAKRLEYLESRGYKDSEEYEELAWTLNSLTNERERVKQIACKLEALEKEGLQNSEQYRKLQDDWETLAPELVNAEVFLDLQLEATE